MQSHQMLSSTMGYPLKGKNSNTLAFTCVLFIGFLVFQLLDAAIAQTLPVCRPVDRDALLRFKEGAMGNNSSTTCLESWINSENCCGWSGVNCENVTGHVVALNLSSCALEGMLLAEALGNISLLQVLDLSNNRFQKTKLREVLASLQELNQSLVYLDLRGITLTGMIPHSIRDFQMLRHLDLGNNLLEGTITIAVFQLEFLEVLHLDANQLEGAVATSIGNLEHLRELNLTHNSLTGVIPEELGQCSNLTILDMSNNFFEGSLPTSIGNLTALRYLSLLNQDNSRSNCLGGPLPTEIGKLIKLEFLDFSKNAFTGSVPASWGQLSSLRFLHLTTNHLSGDLPLSLGNLSSLISLDLSYNYHLTGPLPRALGNLRMGVYRLLFCSNRFSGAIPSEWNNLGVTLKSLSLYNNSLSGPIPPMNKLTHLEVLDLSYNYNLTGAFPAWILGSRDTLRILEVSFNQLTGTLPTWLSSFPNLQILNVAGNILTGNIPEDLSKLTTLTQLTQNEVVPLWTDQVVVTARGNALEYDSITINIKSFDISNNNLQGHIPVELGALQGLLFLNLANCNLTGTIPSEISNLTNLETLDFSSNRLEGVIPPLLADRLLRLNHLNLSHNNLSGAIPRSNQFGTFNATAFGDNPLLCGPPTAQICMADTLVSTSGDSWEDMINTIGFAIGVALGFAMIMLTIGSWKSARSWVLDPHASEVLWYGHFKQPSKS